MRKETKKALAHSALRNLFATNLKLDNWVHGMERLKIEYGLDRLNPHETRLACAKLGKGDAYEYCKKQLNAALS